MRQVLLSIMIIAGVISLCTVGTYAGFVDTETSEGNSFQAGTAELQLGDFTTGGATYPDLVDDEDYGEDPLGDSVTETWDYHDNYPNGMQPGDWLEGRVKLRNFGNMEADSLGIDCVTTNYDSSGNEVDVPKDAVMVIEYLKYWNNVTLNIVWTVSGTQYKNTTYIDDYDGDGRITLRDWRMHSIVGLDAPALADGVDKEESYVEMMVVFDPPALGDTGHPYWRSDQYSGYRTKMTLIFNME